MIKKLTYYLLSIALLLPATLLYSQSKGTVPEFIWKQSLPINWGSPEIAPIGGTEIRALVSFNKSLFAANGYWVDDQSKNPVLPGAQVFRLDAADGKWQVDLELSERNQAGLCLYQAISVLEKVHITTDSAGKHLTKPVDLLLASVWKRGLGLDYFSRTAQSNTWVKTTIPGQAAATRGTQIRAFILHKDQVTGTDIVFAGATNMIFNGRYSSKRQKMVWNAQPEWQRMIVDKPGGGKGRVATLINCNGKLYAAAYNSIFERVDGLSPTWKKVFEISIHSPSDKVTGFRGLTAIRNPTGPGEVLLVSVEDNPCQIYRVDPQSVIATGAYKGILELDVSALLTKAIGTRATYGIAAYNNMTEYPALAGNCSQLLIGVETNTPQATQSFHGHMPNGYFLIRDCNANYTLHEIQDTQITPKPPLESVRTLIISPFAADPPGTIYAGGFDCNSNPAHNTAWLYKGVVVK